MEEKKVMTPPVKGLIISILVIIFTVVIVKTKQETNQDLIGIMMAIVFAGTIGSALLYAKQMKGNVTSSSVFFHGFKTSAMVAATVGFWLAIAFKYFFPEVLDHAMEIPRQAMIKAGDKTMEEIAVEIEKMKKISLPYTTVVTAILCLFIGALGSLLGATFAKKNNG